MISFLFTTDFSTELYNILKGCSGLDLSLMISGGSLLKCLDDRRYEELDTSKWVIFYSDERTDQEQLNYTASIPFISKLRAKVHRIDSSIDVQKAVEEYSGKLVDIDVCLLGIGGDGHVCSLLPGSTELDSEEYVVALEGDFPTSPRRISVTLKFINEKVSRLYFVVPNSKDKNVSRPDESIMSRLKKDFVVMLCPKD